MTTALIILCIFTVLANEGWNLYKRMVYKPPPPQPKPQPDFSRYRWEIVRTKNAAQQVTGHVARIYHNDTEICQPFKVEADDEHAHAEILRRITDHAERFRRDL